MDFSALSFRFMFWLAGILAMAQVSQAREGKPSSLAKGYNSPWPKGRGFEVGQTVPDIPLYDMQGNEVRFSSYLGKQYILYCWASW